MNKPTLSLAAAALLAQATAISAAPEITVYGKVNVTLNNVDQELVDLSDPEAVAIDEWQLNSNASRLGVKGKHAINENLNAIFQLEYEVFIDDGADSENNALKQRNIYAGLQGEFGTVIAGKHDTPLKLAQGKIDRFGDLKFGDIKNILSGEDRVSNIIMYTTPIMNGFSATAAIVPGEDTQGEKDGVADGSSVSLNYKNQFVTAALARNDDINFADTTRLAAEITSNDVKVGLILQSAEESEGSSEEDSFVISAAINVPNDFIVKAQYSFADTSGVNENLVEIDIEASQMAFGVDKKLDKNNTLFAYYSNIESESGDNISLDDSTFAIGYELKF